MITIQAFWMPEPVPPLPRASSIVNLRGKAFASLAPAPRAGFIMLKLGALLSFKNFKAVDSAPPTPV
jgi:hypothetical protein